MPIFEYVCKQCKRPFEALVMGSQKATCPNCGSGDLQDKFSTYAVRASGSGWRGEQWSGGGCGAQAGGG
ncbi:MAG: FmdB family zinc ribbon protein [Terriglobales bacterium]